MWKPAVRLGALGLLAVVVALCAFRVQTDDSQAEIITSTLEKLSVVPDLLHAAEPIATMLLTEFSRMFRREVWTGRSGLAVALAAVAAMVPVALRLRRPATTDGGREHSIRLWALGFVAALAVLCTLDAFLIGRQGAAIRERIVAEYPDSFRGRRVAGERRQRESIGEPFELAFDDAITGRRVSMEKLRGKVVVVDFWATWCGPCVGEIPEMKRLHAEYRDRGVEFIGVSLDLPEEDGGLEALKAFVAKEGVDWPQYFQGHDNHRVVTGAPTEDFAESWGISGIPTVYLIDAEGKLYSTEARGHLETLIPRLLKKSGDSPDQ